MCHSARYHQISFYKAYYQLAFLPTMRESAYLLKAALTCVVKLLNSGQCNR